MDAEILLGFIEEAQNILPKVRGSILLCTKEGKTKSEFDASIKQMHTLKGASAMIGLSEISGIAKDLEQDLTSLAEINEKLTEKQSNDLLDKLSKLEVQTAELSLGLDEFEIDASALIEESFENLQPNESVNDDSNEASDEVEDSFEDFEIDDEMLEIFAMEAEDHLRNINENLQILEKNSNNREALLEIRRSSHTLKGSAGIVGLKTLSKLAHKVEDLLDYISDNNIESNEEIFHLLLSATDCISAVTNNETSDELTEKIERTQIKLVELLETLQSQTESSEESEKGVEVVKPLIQKDDISTKPIESAISKLTNEHAIHTASAPSTRPVIRVSLDKLDDLVKLVGEMVFSRSVFEQRIADLQQQIDELQNSTRRLRHSTGKLETSVEFGILGNSPLTKSLDQSFAPTQNIFGSSELAGETDNFEFDSLEFDRYTEFNQTTRELIETTSDTISINNELDTVHSFLEMLFDSQKHLIDEMQDTLLSLRMVSFGTLTSRLQRTVRVTAEEEGKLVELHIEGEHLEVDTQILDSLIDPLLHLLRNAVAHGIEPPETRRLIGKDEKGKITLRAYSEGTHIVLSITDDGRGISSAGLVNKAVASGMISLKEVENLTEDEAFSLVFLPGITTAEEVSQVSGRGVGMNIVKTNVERQKGTILINSELQKGTTFTLRLPMALAVTRSLLVEAGGQTFAFPLKLVKHISEIAPKNLEQARVDKKLRLGDVNYTVSHLNELLGLPVEPTTISQDIPLLLLETVKNPCALVVDKIIKPQEIVIKPLGNPLKDVQSLLGATLLGDGSVIPVLDLTFLLDERTPIIKQPKLTALSKEKLSVMIVDDSPSVRHVNTTLVKNNNWEPIIAKDGMEAFDILTTSKKLPDVILTDVEMPEMDGYELLAAIKQNQYLHKIPVVMITSRASDKHRRKAYDLGVSEYLTKPYDDSVLVGIIKKLSN